MSDFSPVPKPIKRKKKTPKSKITQSARQEVYKRSGGKCERCGRTQAYAFEVAHLVQASKQGRGDDPENLALLCGPSVNSGTCHNFADYTTKGKEWRMNKRKELMQYYGRH